MFAHIGPASVIWTDGADGALGHKPPRADHDDECCGLQAQARRDAVRPGPWKYLTQVHGASVVNVNSNTQPGGEADAQVTTEAGVVLAIATADCAPVALGADNGMVAAVHAGWRGLDAGIVQRTAQHMRAAGAQRIFAGLGACVRAECYAFPNDEKLSAMQRALAPNVRSVTSTGQPALDLPAGIRAALSQVDVELVFEDQRCTACSGEHFSFRMTNTSDRQVMLVTRDA